MIALPHLNLKIELENISKTLNSSIRILNFQIESN
jgi:hypothetical protein